LELPVGFEPTYSPHEGELGQCFFPVPVLEAISSWKQSVIINI